MNEIRSTALDDLLIKNAAQRLPKHDVRLYQNSPTVHTIAKHISRAMEEFGVQQVAAGFRIAVALEDDRRRRQR